MPQKCGDRGYHAGSRLQRGPPCPPCPKKCLPILAAELSEGARWHQGTPEWQAFVANLQAGRAWAERRPRWLLAWARKQAIPMSGTKRFALVMNAGFDCPERWRLWRAAKAELRRARAAIARGEESGLAYADGRDLLVFGGGSQPRYGAPGSWLRPTYGGSPAGPMPVAEAPAPSTAPSTPAPSSPRPAPGTPRPGSWITRRG
jgi:hypothetical protein